MSDGVHIRVRCSGGGYLGAPMQQQLLGVVPFLRVSMRYT